MKKKTNAYLKFSKKERNGAIFLSICILIVISLPIFFKSNTKKTIIDSATKQQIDELIASAASEKEDSNQHHYYNSDYNSKWKKEEANTTFEPFYFDPNTVDSFGWRKLGLRDKTIHTILNFTHKGGSFRKPEDIKKIWGLRPEESERILPYVKIDTSKFYHPKQNKVETKPSIVDINTATLEDLKRIPGMGNGIVFKVINYRDKIGGFINMEQLKEAHGMTDSSFVLMKPFLILNSEAIHKIDINKASDFELGAHPYIEKNIAKAIVIYRTQHGNYHSVKEIKNIVFIKEAIFQKISPYLTVE